MSGRVNPFVLIHSVSNDSSDFETSGSPRAKFISTCMNCNYTFRLGSSDSNEFCSKGLLYCSEIHHQTQPHDHFSPLSADCQTCYLIYISNPAHTPKKFKQEQKTGKQLVYEFQKELDRQNDEAARVSEDDDRMVEIHELSSSPVKFPTKSAKIVVTPTAKRGWFGTAALM